MKLRPVLALAVVLVSVGLAAVPQSAVAASTLNGHPVALDQYGRVIPWTSTPGDGYGQVIDSAWRYLLGSVPNDSSNGKPAYFSHSYLDPDTQVPAGWPHNPAGLYAMLIESALKYYAYSGDAAPVALAKNVASWQLAHGMTSPTDNWGSVPYSSGESGQLTYNGASYGNSTGVGDGVGVLQPDKVGALGYGWLQLYRFDGTTAYRDAAVKAADALASHVRTGNATQSPWPFRVTAATGAAREEYSANVIEPIQLLDSLIALGIGNVEQYAKARQIAWTWLMTYPMVTNVWANYFEDVSIRSNRDNLNQLVPMMTARYLLQHPEMDPNWRAHVKGLLDWVARNFGETRDGATVIREQLAFNFVMGSHTSRYASVNALYAQATGDATAKTSAYYSLNWATYMARNNGVVIDGPEVNNQWFTDGYGDYIRHFLTSMQAFPEWAPAGKTHVTGSTSLVNSVTYGAASLTYTTADRAAVDALRLAFAPTSVTADGAALPRTDDLTSTDGWTFDTTTGVLRVRHSGRSVVVSAGDSTTPTPTPTTPTTPPTSPTTTSPTTREQSDDHQSDDHQSDDHQSDDHQSDHHQSDHHQSDHHQSDHHAPAAVGTLGGE